jgi:hypothetical protein
MTKASTIISIPGRPRVTLCDARYFTQKEFAKITEALCILSYVLQSPEFYDEMMKMHFTTTKLSNETIFKIITEGDDVSTGVTGSFGMDHSEIDHELDFVMSAYCRRWSKVIGYVVPGKITNYINRKYLTSMKPWDLAGHLFHEKLHQLGFKHASAKDHDSVPYALGYLVAELGEDSYAYAISSKKPVIETVIYTGALL